MLLVNKNLLRLSRGLRGWIVGIALLRLLILVGVAGFTQTLAGFMGQLFSGVTQGDILLTLRDAGLNTLVILAGNLLVGEAEFRCTMQSRRILREKLYDKLLELDVSNIDAVGTANATTAVVDGIENIQIYYSKYLPGLLYYFTAPLYIFWKVYRFSPVVAAFLLGICILILPINNLFRSIIERLKSGYWRSLRELTAYYLESLQALTTLKLFNRDEDRTLGLKERADDFNRTIMHVMRINFLATMTTNALMYLSIFGAILMLCRQADQGSIAMPQALTVLMLSYSFYSSVRMLMDATHRALNGIAAAQSIEDILRTEVHRPVLPMPKAPEAQEAGLRLEQLRFAYPGRADALRDVSLFFPAGQVSAIVGASGCGKSTLLSLLLRFREPTQGRVLLNGVDLRCYSPDQVRQHITMVPQSITVFSGTLAENLRMANPDATPAQMRSVLEKVRLGSWLETLPNGLDTDLGDGGAKLSGGQKQKIGIARALLTEADYVLLDEATSSVDPESEQEIRRCITEISQHRTLIIVSHRLSAIRNADRIFVLRQGQLVEQGSHDALMARQGHYAAMVSEQERLEHRGEGPVHGQ